MVDEQIGHGDAEQLRHAQGQGQAWIIFVGFDRVDRLPRDAEPLGKLALAPPPPLADRLQPILQDDPPAVKSSLQCLGWPRRSAGHGWDNSRSGRALSPIVAVITVVDLNVA